MKPAGLKTKIFLDSGDPAETRRILSMLGFLDGQTTNPTLVAKNPYARERFEKGEKFSEIEIYDFYNKVVSEISSMIPEGSVSVEVYADHTTTADAMLDQGKSFYSWIPNAHIKYPITEQGLEAAVQSLQLGMKVNMTLCFSQSQAAAVYAATNGAKRGEVFVSPFVGRLDDRGENGMDLIANIIKMYKDTDSHTEVLAASIRNQEHLMQCLALGVDIITAPFAVLEAWGKAGMPVPNSTHLYDHSKFKDIEYLAIDLDDAWQTFDISDDLTDKGIDRFALDWNALID